MRWDSSADGTCWPSSAIQGLGYADATLNITTDVCFAVIIPVALFWDLQVNRRTRLSLIVILGLGVFACIAATLKIIYMYNLGDYTDWLWDSRPLTIWNVVELNIGITAGSLPAIKPIFKSILERSYPSQTQPRECTHGSGVGMTTLGSRRRSTWVKISSLQRPGLGMVDEAGSQRALDETGAKAQVGAAGQEGLEMGSFVFVGHKTQDTVDVTDDFKASLGVGGVDETDHAGIKITTTTTITSDEGPVTMDCNLCRI